MFYYDPKLKAKLPYYDRFPLVIPFGTTSDGFIGMNLHYLAPRPRIGLLNELSRHVLNGQKMDETTRFRLSWNILQRSAALDAVKPCVKRYLSSHVGSEFLKINADEWYIAALLPVQNFAKASAQEVWKDSTR